MLRRLLLIVGIVAPIAVGLLGNVVTSAIDPTWTDKRLGWLIGALLALVILVIFIQTRPERARAGAGTATVGRIAACARPDGNGLHLFGVTSDGDLMSGRYEETGSWSGWELLSLPGGVRAHDVTAMTGTEDIVELYIADRDGVVRGRRLGNDGWSAWEDLGVPPQAGPVTAVGAVSAFDEHRELYAVGRSGRVAHRWLTDRRTWADWHSAHHDGARDIAVSRLKSEHMECFVIDRDGEVRHRWRSKATEYQWTGWYTLNRAPGSTSRALTTLNGKEGHQEVFVAGVRGDLAHRWLRLRDEKWSDWSGKESPGDVVDLTAAATSVDRWQLFAVDKTGALWVSTYGDPRWSAWRRVR
jgi:hypothetical protein